MSHYKQLKEDYLLALAALIDNWKNNAIELRANNSTDEAILEQIKVNVGDIFYKIFNVSYKNTYKNTKNDQCTEIQYEKLYTSYLTFFNKIPAPWKEKALKDKEHNIMDEYYKEELKLATVDKIKNLFIDYYEKYRS